MRKIALFLCIAAVFAAACTPGQKYRISGTWPDGDGRIVYLQKQLDKDVYEILDSAKVADGRFEMRGRVPHVDKYIVEIDGSNQDVIIDDVPVTFEVYTTWHENKKGEQVSHTEIEVTGSAEQQILRELSELSLGKSFLALGSMFALVEVQEDPVKFDSVYLATEELKNTVDGNIRNYFDSINDSYAITWAIGDFIAREYTLDDVLRYYGNLTQRVKDSYPGQLLTEKVETLRSVNIGGIAPDIDLPSPDGNNAKLSSLRGKYVLLDFWASWCGPCLREVPNVKAIYEDYKDRGFEIYGVSLDKEGERDAWLAKIEEYGMDWVHVSSLKGWECPAAKSYNVTGIPKMYLLDRDGRIIAMDLRGEELREKVASLFP